MGDCARLILGAPPACSAQLSNRLLADVPSRDRTPASRPCRRGPPGSLADPSGEVARERRPDCSRRARPTGGDPARPDLPPRSRSCRARPADREGLPGQSGWHAGAPCAAARTSPTDIALDSSSPPRSPSTVHRSRIRFPRTSSPPDQLWTQKAIHESLLRLHEARIVDGVGVRLPTICIRPGRPNKAASGSSRTSFENPWFGQQAVLPVRGDGPHWFASPRSAVDFLEGAAALNGDAVGPGPACRCRSARHRRRQIDAVPVAGERAVRLIRREPGMRPSCGWSRHGHPPWRRPEALSLGFAAERSFDEIIRAHVEDELGGSL